MQGSFQNHLARNQKWPEPVVGMGATELHYTDRSACTIVEVSKNKKTVIVVRDEAIRTDKNGMSEIQEYRYEPRPDGCRLTYTLRKNNRWVRQGQNCVNGDMIAIGYRSAYHDYSF